jgi:hypothetical protein
MSDLISQFEDEPSFSLNDFKKWMANQTDKPLPAARRIHELVGTYVDSRLSQKRLVNQIVVEEGDVEELAKDFRRHGGVIRQVGKEDNVLVEVSSGTFFIPKFFVRQR